MRSAINHAHIMTGQGGDKCAGAGKVSQVLTGSDNGFPAQAREKFMGHGGGASLPHAGFQAPGHSGAQLAQGPVGFAILQTISDHNGSRHAIAGRALKPGIDAAPVSDI